MLKVTNLVGKPILKFKHKHIYIYRLLNFCIIFKKHQIKRGKKRNAVILSRSALNIILKICAMPTMSDPFFVKFELSFNI